MSTAKDNEGSNIDQKDYWTSVWKNKDTEDYLMNNSHKDDRRILETIIRNETVGNRIMEAGCGLGQWVICLADKGYDVVGLDYSEPTIQRLNQTYPSYKWVVGDITDLRYGNETFDAVLSWGVVEHFVEGPEQALDEAYRILKRGGRLYITVPCNNYLMMLLSPLSLLKRNLTDNRFIRRMRGLDYPRPFYQYEFRKKVFQNYIVSRGFEIEKLEPIAHDFGFALTINNLLRFRRKKPKIFYASNDNSWQGLTLSGRILSSSLKRISSWFTPQEMFIVAKKN
jgi:SAM-dependent methyltransferase